MAKIKPIYEELPEFVEIMEKIIDLYPNVFPNIAPDEVAAIKIINKERPEKKSQVWELKPVVPPITLFCPKKYFVTLFSSDWDAFSQEHKAAVVADVLMSMDPEEGKTIPFDTKDHGAILRTLGIDYMNEAEIPNILGGNVEWKI